MIATKPKTETREEREARLTQQTRAKWERKEAAAARKVRKSLPADATGAELAETSRKLALEMRLDKCEESMAWWNLGCFITAERNAAITAGDIELTEAWFEAWRVFFYGPTMWERRAAAQSVIDQANARGER